MLQLSPIIFQVVLDEFYTAGGKASHVLHILDTSETKTKANEVGLNILVSEFLNIGFRLQPFFTLLKFWCYGLLREGVAYPPCRFCLTFKWMD